MIINPKQAALEAISELPETATFDDAMYRIYALEKISNGEDAIAKGDIIFHEDLVREMDKW